MNTVRLPKPIGQVAHAYGACLRVEVLENAEGFYIGTREGDLPFSRESVESYPSRAAADRALNRGTWTQRQLPVQGKASPSTAALSGGTGFSHLQPCIPWVTMLRR